MSRLLCLLFALSLHFSTQAQINIKTNVYFASGSSYLDDENKMILDTFILDFKEAPKAKFYIKGHTDSIGSLDYNDTLGLQRARSVHSYFKTNAQASQKLKFYAAGENEPVADNGTDSGRSNNRRVTVTGRVHFFYTKDNDFHPEYALGATMILPVEFEFNSWALKPESLPLLSSIADTLKAHPNLIVEVGGFIAIDGKGSIPGKDLSEERAKTVYNYLIDTLGIAPSRLTYKGYQGKKNAPCPGCNSNQQIRKNRRVEITIIGK